jgi:membrane protease subunit HflC
MKGALGIISAVLLGSAAFVGLNSIYTISERQQAIVLQFGAPVAVKNDITKNEAGLHFKVPFIQNVEYLDRRNIGSETDSQEVVTSDQERLEVDAFVRWRINNPLTFYQRLRNERVGADRLATLTTGVLRATLGDVSSKDIISGQRAQLMSRIAQALNAQAADLGIQIIDVRIKRADLPQANSERVFERMRTERQQQAAQFRAEGTESSERIRAEADRQRTVALADAREQSEIVRGTGDAERNRIYADAFGKDPEFAAFYRAMIAYDRSFQDGTPMVLSPDSEFFRYFNNGAGR